MKISPNYKIAYIPKTTFRAKNFKSVSVAIEKLKAQLQNSKLYAQSADCSIDFRKSKKIEDEYYKKIMATFFDDFGSLKSEAREFMETITLDIKQNNSTTKKSIRDVIKDSIVEKEKMKGTFFHATEYKEMGDKIIQEGFNPLKISRTKYGPGFYFSPSEGGARFYSSCVLRGDLEGNCAIVRGPFYETVANYETIKKLRDKLGLNSSAYLLANVEENALTRLINEYSRDILTNELGCDLAYNAGTFDACFVVFNPKAITNVRFN